MLKIQHINIRRRNSHSSSNCDDRLSLKDNGIPSKIMDRQNCAYGFGWGNIYIFFSKNTFLGEKDLLLLMYFAKRKQENHMLNDSRKKILFFQIILSKS